jgi:hypothetical protein
MVQRVESLRVAPTASAGALLTTAAIALGGALFLIGAGLQVWGTLFVVGAVIGISIPVLARQARRELDGGIFAFLIFALVVKLLGGVLRHFVAFNVYGGVADAAGYHRWGIRLAAQFWEGNFDTGFDTLSSTNFIRFLTGIFYAIIGPNQLGGFILFSWLGFLGLFMFYRAFQLSFPEAATKTYAKLLFFLPSLVFWPSSIGKEAWMMFSLGIAAYGIAQALRSRPWRGLLVAGAGLWLAALVRPHVAGLMGIALVVGFVARRPSSELRHLAPIIKGLSVCLLLIAAGFLVAKTDQFLRDESNIDTSSGVASVLAEVSDRTGQGGSEFAPSVLESPLRAPIAVVTVLFRPLAFDAHNVQSLIAAAEGTFLLLYSLFRFSWIVGALRSLRKWPYAAFAFSFTGLFVFAFSSLANFGLLARERVQLLPVFLVLLCIRKARDPLVGNDEPVNP